MAIVAEYQFDKGTVRFDDDCYRGVPQEELDRRLAQARAAAWKMVKGRKNETDV